MTQAKPKIWVTLPTFNEAGNIESLIDTLLKLRPDMGVIVIDDDSPDGTWRIVEGLSQKASERVVLLRRTQERGRGSAGVAGFCKAIELDAEYVVEMDADWSHDPRFIPDLLKAAKGYRRKDGRKVRGADVVIGSRLAGGGGERGRSWTRTWITYAANAYLRMVLGLRIRDCTTGFRVFRRRVLEGIDWKRVDSNGPAIVQEVLLACHAQRARIVERPILFEPRRAGTSTFNARIMLSGFFSALQLRFRSPAIKTSRKGEKK